MRFRCPDTSPPSSITLPPPSNLTTSQKPRLCPLRPRKKVAQTVKPAPAPPTLRRSSSSLRRREQIPGKLKRTDSASLAAKREQRRAKADKKHKEAPKSAPKQPYSFVYAGNLEPTITEEQLRDRFSPCGPILRIIIRCSRGQPIKALPEGMQPEIHFGPRDRKYASIEFSDSRAYLEALQLDGQIIDGAKMIVSISAADLPEAKELLCGVSDRPAQSLRRLQSPFNSLAKNSAYRTSIPISPNTKLQKASKPPDVPTTSEGDRFRFLGLSFAKCII